MLKSVIRRILVACIAMPLLASVAVAGTTQKVFVIYVGVSGDFAPDVKKSIEARLQRIPNVRLATEFDRESVNYGIDTVCTILTKEHVPISALACALTVVSPMKGTGVVAYHGSAVLVKDTRDIESMANNYIDLFRKNFINR